MTLSSTDISSFAIDSQGLDKLRLQAKQSPDQALKAVAKQFESVFMNMMLKSMRDATPQDGVFDSEQTKMFTGMLDQQLAQSMASRGIGLADVMVRQLSHTQHSSTADHKTITPTSANSVPSAYNTDVQQSFVNKLKVPAEQASRSTGVPAHLILGQAALESGWGKREIKMTDGTNSYNLFGIKAGKDWNGKVAEVMTTEYHNGVASQQLARFRAYGSYAESFHDYAKLLSDNPRYAGVVGQGDVNMFAQGLQQAGYATDPHYADKLTNVIGSISARA